MINLTDGQTRFPTEFILFTLYKERIKTQEDVLITQINKACFLK